MVVVPSPSNFGFDSLFSLLGYVINGTPLIFMGCNGITARRFYENLGFAPLILTEGDLERGSITSVTRALTLRNELLRRTDEKFRKPSHVTVLISLNRVHHLCQLIKNLDNLRREYHQLVVGLHRLSRQEQNTIKKRLAKYDPIYVQSSASLGALLNQCGVFVEEFWVKLDDDDNYLPGYIESAYSSSDLGGMRFWGRFPASIFLR